MLPRFSDRLEGGGISCQSTSGTAEAGVAPCKGGGSCSSRVSDCADYAIEDWEEHYAVFFDAIKRGIRL
jgi:hypothetical protein